MKIRSRIERLEDEMLPLPADPPLRLASKLSIQRGKWSAQRYSNPPLGATDSAPQYAATQTGFVYTNVFCPDAATCANVVPQLLYSFSSIKPWSLAVPIAWDSGFSSFQPPGILPRWSATGVQDATHQISFAICNQFRVPAVFSVQVFDANGSLIGQAATPSIPVVTVQGFLLRDLIPTPLPPGVLKITVEGGPSLSSVAFFQFEGDYATNLQVSYDGPLNPGSGSEVEEYHR